MVSRYRAVTVWTCAAVPWVKHGVQTARPALNPAPQSIRASALEAQASPTEATSSQADPSTKVLL